MADSDKHYIRRCLDGHPDDFCQLVRRYQKPLLAYLAGRMQGRESAEEAAQEAFVRAYFGLGKLKKHGSFFSWLLGIANRVAKEQCRHTTKQRDIEDIANVEERPQEIAEDCTLAEAIAELPDNQRQVILLRFYADCSCKDIAKQLDMPLGTVTKNLSRAYAAMRDSLCRQQK